MYDNDNNIKPIEVNFNNNEYIIFFFSPPSETFMMTIIVRIHTSLNKIYLSSSPNSVANVTKEFLSFFLLESNPAKIYSRVYSEWCWRENSHKMIQTQTHSLLSSIPDGMIHFWLVFEWKLIEIVDSWRRRKSLIF